MRDLPLTSGINPLNYNIFHEANNEDSVFTPSILTIQKVGGIFIHSCGFFYVRFVRFV
jgi:hypothetical protein